MSSENIDKLNRSLLHERIFLSCQNVPDKIALQSSEDSDNYFSYNDIKTITPQIASSLKAGGVEQQDKIGLLAENCPEWGIAYLSILCAGGIVVPLDPALKPSELASLLKLSKVKLVFVSEKLLPKINESIAAIDNDLRTIQLDTIRKLSNETADSFLCQNIKPETPAVLIYTSGTTGDPKAVVLTHKNLLANLDSIATAIRFYPDDIFLSLLPLFHTFEAT